MSTLRCGRGRRRPPLPGLVVLGARSAGAARTVLVKRVRLNLAAVWSPSGYSLPGTIMALLSRVAEDRLRQRSRISANGQRAVQRIKELSRTRGLNTGNERLDVMGTR